MSEFAPGTLHVVMDGGSEFACRPGDVSLLPKGYDAWVVGNEAAAVVDFLVMVGCIWAAADLGR
ncbi:hypothetical protein [Oryzomonas japonica]|uniref:hypothetical protein n=1 Tax=Oryzomonas japonica TaxID=2603858 RepID=UPI00178163CB|nr:hypothetical protein [Oryzomonas japonica]